MKASRAQIKKIGRLSCQSAYDLMRKTKRKWIASGFVLQVSPFSETPRCFFKREPVFEKNSVDLVGSISPSFKLLVSVSKKTARRSVDRSRIKRRMRAVAADVLPEHACPGFAYSLTGRAACLDKPYAELHRDLVWCLKRMNLLRTQQDFSGLPDSVQQEP